MRHQKPGEGYCIPGDGRIKQNKKIKKNREPERLKTEKNRNNLKPENNSNPKNVKNENRKSENRKIGETKPTINKNCTAVCFIHTKQAAVQFFIFMS